MASKHFNIRLTGEHSETSQNVKKIAEHYKVVIAAYEDIAWQNNKPEKPHVHIIIETTQGNPTIKKFINNLGYHGNEQYKIGRPVEDLEKALQYACKGRSKGDTANIEYFENLKKIEEYNLAFWKIKKENDKNFKQKGDSLRMSIQNIISKKDEYTDFHGNFNIEKLTELIITEYKIRNIGYNYNVIEKYINLAISKIDLQFAAKMISDKYQKFNEPGILKISKSKSKIDYYYKDDQEEETSTEDEYS